MGEWALAAANARAHIAPQLHISFITHATRHDGGRYPHSHTKCPGQFDLDKSRGKKIKTNNHKAQPHVFEYEQWTRKAFWVFDHHAGEWIYLTVIAQWCITRHLSRNADLAIGDAVTRMPLYLANRMMAAAAVMATAAAAAAVLSMIGYFSIPYCMK